MIVIGATNVGEAYRKGLALLAELGENVETRNGPALRAPAPVTTVYAQPCERVIFDPARDANPFFHFMESMWMLDGRRDVPWLTRFNKNIANYSDDGETFHGAYGYRWRHAFGFDQLEIVIERLKADPTDRRSVVQIWDAQADLATDSLDIPCNDTVKFDIRKGWLNMYVFNRSNDMIWGAYGANAVHFSYLQEYMAAMIGVEVGHYYQISCDFHAYRKVFEDKYCQGSLDYNDRYALWHVNPYTMVGDPASFDDELTTFVSGEFDDWVDKTWNNLFFPEVALPMLMTWALWKDGKRDDAVAHAEKIEARDWRAACIEWMKRRIK